MLLSELIFDDEIPSSTELSNQVEGFACKYEMAKQAMEKDDPNWNEIGWDLNNNCLELSLLSMNCIEMCKVLIPEETHVHTMYDRLRKQIQVIRTTMEKLEGDCMTEGNAREFCTHNLKLLMMVRSVVSLLQV